MKKLMIFAAITAAVNFTACNSGNKGQTEAETTETEQAAGEGTATDTSATGGTGAVMEKNGLKVYSFDTSPKFPDADLDLEEPDDDSKVPSGEVKFVYELKNYQLTAQTTEGPAHLDHANSKEGQHIHNIVDNEPYTAHYTTTFTKPVKDGSHVILSFLSRSYHESLKHKDAYDLRVVNVGNSTTGPGANFDDDGKHLFYSRPKGDYTGNDTKKVMLDFYLVNTDLSDNGDKVRATINGTEFILNQWLPYTIEGLPMGENTIKLELIDKDGKVVPGPFNTVERKFTLKAS
ncbi:hypothetical protein AAE02nite_09810 [Adhaeribacter aerolatus]|uniref:Phosphopeptide-binding protein n=1 Tax=Adhaeribacter aerolatus TaxID=670289 RepID=A0A512AUV6_9BACT|nr:hypothetical protein [Adhaeribacter aerolatus]GEO03317.1 hypothetical protein AAE02nite_09810 [Adhaeribacter aerolatus]